MELLSLKMSFLKDRINMNLLYKLFRFRPKIRTHFYILYNRVRFIMVTKKTPSDCIAGGNPAKIIRELN